LADGATVSLADAVWAGAGRRRAAISWAFRWLLLFLATPAAAASCGDVSSGKCHVVLATGIDMAYVETGPADGKPVILVHGLTDSLRSWAPAMRALHRLDPSLRIIAVDQRGHGDSTLPTGAGCPSRPETCFGMADLAADLAAFMTARHLPKSVFAGHSLGSFVVQELALSHPDLVERVVLVATATKVTSLAPAPGALPEDVLIGPWRRALDSRGQIYPAGCWALTPLDADPDAAAWIAARWDVDPVADPDFVSAIVPETARVRLGTWIGATRGAIAADTTGRLAAIAMPVLVLWGSQDSIFTAADQDAVKRELARAGARGVPVFWKRYGRRDLPPSGVQEDDIGHNVQWDAPDQVAADIDAFIRHGRPTADLARSAGPPDIRRIVVERRAAGDSRL
jgi:pimeloyl-ACP methyl ester carboxylesterase